MRLALGGDPGESAGVGEMLMWSGTYKRSNWKGDMT